MTRNIAASMSRAQSPVRGQTFYVNILMEKLVEVTNAIQDLKDNES